MKNVLIFLFCTIFSFFILPFDTLGQKCGTDDLHAHYAQIDPDYLSRRESIRKKTSTTSTVNKASGITIPVVFHIIYRTEEQNISDAQIQSQLDVMNKDYNKQNWDTMKVPSVWKNLIASVGFNFVLANRDPDGNVTSGITRTQTTIQDIGNINGSLHYQTSKGGHDIWDRNSYLNIWVCEISGGVYGFASLPGAPAESDGVVIDFIAFGTQGTAKAPTDKGRTATHEIGHWFDLQHLWAFSSVPPCGDDGLLDTPLQETGNFGCATFPHNTSCNQTANGEMFVNFMDYSDDHCLNMFTLDQKDKMNTTLTTLRSSLLNSQGYNGISKHSQDKLSLNPNPANQWIHISGDVNKPILYVEIFDLQGRLIHRENAGMKRDKFSLDVREFKNGIYVLKVQTETGLITEKMLVWHP